MTKTEPVVLYTHMGCPGGDAARRHFDEAGIAYLVYDVVTDKGAQAEFRRLGGIGTPLIVAAHGVMHGFDPQEFHRLMQSNTGGPNYG